MIEFREWKIDAAEFLSNSFSFSLVRDSRRLNEQHTLRGRNFTFTANIACCLKQLFICRIGACGKRARTLFICTLQFTHSQTTFNGLTKVDRTTSHTNLFTCDYGAASNSCDDTYRIRFRNFPIRNNDADAESEHTLYHTSLSYAAHKSLQFACLDFFVRCSASFFSFSHW